MGVGRPIFSVLLIGAAFLLAAHPKASFAEDGYSMHEPAQFSGGMDVHQQVNDTTDQVDDTADQAGDQVQDTADQGKRQVSNAGDGVLDKTRRREDGSESSEVTNSKPTTGSETRELFGAGNDVSGEPAHASSTSTSKEADPGGGLLSFTGSRGVILAATLSLLLIGLGIALMSIRRRHRQTSTAHGLPATRRWS